RMLERPLTNNGGVSAFVFLDKDGDNVFSDGDEPIPGVVIQAPQNGGRITTDSTGYAFMSRMTGMRLTDVMLDPSSLPDPLWAPGFAGMSVLPREGHGAKIDFPVHQAGEIDGTVYARAGNGDLRPLRGIRLDLYSGNGDVVASATSEPDGFYLFG